MKTDQTGPASLSNEGSGAGSTRSLQSTVNREEQLAKTEDMWVQRSKGLVIAVLFLSASVFGAFAYLFTAQEERKDFKAGVRLLLITFCRC
jgi:hypothetical protein